tara:strand:+ start:9897 stop:10541 length:645 start_codon:yes stop_codon:yes gene_type:complete
MIYDIEIAKQLAKYLLQINAIILQPQQPFKWASGWNSPIYCDNRRTLSFPNIRNFIRISLSSAINNKFKGVNVIAGVATAGIPHGALVAEELGLPFIYVRNEAKNHGRKNQIEGHVDEGQSVVLIEDLISSGKSSIESIKILRKSNINVKGLISIFNYGFDQSRKNFENANCEYLSLCDYKIMLPEALERNYITKDDVYMLEKWREDPSNWKNI